MKMLRVTASHDLCDNEIMGLYVALRRRYCDSLVSADVSALTSFLDVLFCFLFL